MAHVRRTLEGHPVVVEAAANREVQIDPRLTSAALSHMLENAARYSPAGQPIVVEGRVAPDGLHVSVTDRGPGLQPSEVDRLFDRFYRGQAGARTMHGTGMGLTIARGLLAAAGGTAWRRTRPAPAPASLTVPGPYGAQRQPGRRHERTHCRRGRRAEHPQHAGPAAACPRLRGDDGGPRVMPLDLVHAGSPDLLVLDLGLPRYRRRRRLRERARRVECANPGALGPRARGRQGAGTRRRGRRLRHEAVRIRRAAGAHPRGPPPRRQRLGISGAVRRQPHHQSPAFSRRARQQRDPVDAQGIRAAVTARGQCRTCPDPPGDPAGNLGCQRRAPARAPSCSSERCAR